MADSICNVLLFIFCCCCCCCHFLWRWLLGCYHHPEAQHCPVFSQSNQTITKPRDPTGATIYYPCHERRRHSDSLYTYISSLKLVANHNAIPRDWMIWRPSHRRSSSSGRRRGIWTSCVAFSRYPFNRCYSGLRWGRLIEVSHGRTEIEIVVFCLFRLPPPPTSSGSLVCVLALLLSLLSSQIYQNFLLSVSFFFYLNLLPSPFSFFSFFLPSSSP